VKVTEVEDKVLEPEGLQAEIDGVVGKYKGNKAFLRASGTENVLRLHVEAETAEQVNDITDEIVRIVSSNKVLN
jgi:phosphoacetylglucosamine mutase